jgi:hypothetical protein
MQENGKFLVGTGTKKVECRIINYCDPKERSVAGDPPRTEFRLATNLPETGEFSASNDFDKTLQFLHCLLRILLSPVSWLLV